MKNINIVFPVLCIMVLVVLTNCKPDKQRTGEPEIPVGFFTDSGNDPGEAKIIFYAISLPVERAAMFRIGGANYNPWLLNP